MTIVIPQTPTLLSSNVSNANLLIDGVVGNSISNANSINLSYHITKCGGIAFFGLDATSVNVSITNNTNNAVIYNKTTKLLRTWVKSWSEYFFKTRQYRNNLFLQIPPIPNATLNITISKPNSVAVCGEIIVGSIEYIGDTEVGLQLNYTDYSTRTQDATTGVISLVRGEYTKGFSGVIWTDDVDRFFTVCSSQRGKIIAAIADDFGLTESSIVIGNIKSFDPVVKLELKEGINFTIEGIL